MAHRRTDGSRAESPAIRLLDALRNGDDAGVLAVCGENTVITAENMRWSCHGRDEIHRWLVEARERFPGVTFESRTRHIGFGLVIDEARVQEVQPDVPDVPGDAEGQAEGQADAEAALEAVPEPIAEAAAEPVEPAPLVEVDSSDHPMWDQPAVTVERNVMKLWRERSEEEHPATALNMPVRVTVRHDDLQVHEVLLSFPAALFKRALGLKVDPFEMSLSEVQSAFIAPVGAGFTTYALDRPELTIVAPPPVDEPEPAPVAAEPPRRRRRRRGRILVPLLLLALLAVGGVYWATQVRGDSSVAAPPSPSPSLSLSPSPSVSPSASASASQPTNEPSGRPPGKPNVILANALAFGFNSSNLSADAKTELDTLARNIRRAGLTGTIYVDGYTDNIGSAAYGKVLSQRRAQAVADYLTSQLGKTDLTVVATGHGEAKPIESNATAAGRQANRRVEITLPKP